MVELGLRQGKEFVNELNRRLAEAGRMDDIVKAASDEAYQRELLEEYGLKYF